MRHHKRRALPDKQIALNMFSSHMKAKVKSCNTTISAPCHSSVCSNNKTEEHFSALKKTKRLKTIKERNQIRGQSKNRCNQSHQHCERESQGKGPCICSVNFSRKEKPVAKPFLSQKPSIITEGRLTSIRGLFSHEVRSVDIERLVKEKKDQKHIEKQEIQVTASKSPSPVMISEGEEGEEGVSERANKDQKSKTLEKKDNLQTNLEGTVPMTLHILDGKHHSAHTAKDTDDITRSGSPSHEKEIQEAGVFSSSESEPVHKSLPTSAKGSPSDHNVSPKKKNTHAQKQTSKTVAAVDVQYDFINSQILDTPAGSEVLYSDAPQGDPSPAIFRFSSPPLDNKRSALGDESQHRKSGFSSKEEAVSRLAARLCDSIGSFPLQRCCPLLTDCKKVLLHHLQERHGSQLQHSLRRLHSHLSTEGPHSPVTAKQVWPSSGQKCLDNTEMYFSFTRRHEDDQQSDTMKFQTDNGSQKHCQREGFYENAERGAASKRHRMQTWGMYSPQDFFRELQQPCQDTLSQWSITAQSQESLIAKEQSTSQTFSLNQAFTGNQTPTPWTYKCTDDISEPFFLEPKKQVKLGSAEIRRRHSAVVPLLEQWRNDPDLDFLFQDKTLTELKMCSPHYNIESVSERPLFGASSTVSAFFPPEGFCYEPYYRFPHPSNSFNSSEKSGMTFNTEKRGLGPSLQLTNHYF